VNPIELTSLPKAPDRSCDVTLEGTYGLAFGLALCWAVLDLVIAGAHGLGLSDLDRRELQRLRLERQNDHAPTALTA
jgi:hypothetical protein